MEAFAALIRRYERSLGALIRSRMGACDAVEDVLQETLMHAWAGLRVQEPRNARAWLYQVARNRCSDYLRSTQRRERVVEAEELTMRVNRLGVAEARQRRSAEDVIEAFEVVPEKERRALVAFYLDGLSIAEIAARHRCPPGTVKRRLSHGRDRVRRELGINKTRRGTARRGTAMSVDDREAAKRPFPERRPEITVSRSTGQPFTIDLREMAWWFIVPEIGDRVRWGEYEQTRDGSAWKLTEVKEMTARRPAIIHGRKCVEIEIGEQSGSDSAGLLPRNHSPEEKERHTRVWGRLEETEVQWIAVEVVSPDGTRELRTFLDEGWEDDFAASPRFIEDKGYLTERLDGTFERRADAPGVFSQGLFDVRIGGGEFECMRVFDIEANSSNSEVIVVAYISREGRTVLFRRYNGNRWGKRDQPPHQWGAAMTWEEDLPHAHRLVIDGVAYVHYYDTLTDESCGL